MPRIILQTDSTNEDFNGDCDFAVVDLTDAVMGRLRGLAAIALRAHESESSLWEMYFWGSPAEYYDVSLLHDMVVADEDYLVLPADFPLDTHDSQRTECDQTVIRLSCNVDAPPTAEVVFFCYPKHSSVGITTRAVDLKALEVLAP